MMSTYGPHPSSLHACLPARYATHSIGPASLVFQIQIGISKLLAAEGEGQVRLEVQATLTGCRGDFVHPLNSRAREILKLHPRAGFETVGRSLFLVLYGAPNPTIITRCFLLDPLHPPTLALPARPGPQSVHPCGLPACPLPLRPPAGRLHDLHAAARPLNETALHSRGQGQGRVGVRSSQWQRVRWVRGSGTSVGVHGLVDTWLQWEMSGSEACILVSGGSGSNSQASAGEHIWSTHLTAVKVATHPSLLWQLCG